MRVHLDWDGCLNARDLGGLPTQDGRTTREGILFRSDTTCALTERGRLQVLHAGVKTVIDLRGDWELATEPNPFVATEGITYLHRPMNDNAVDELIARIASPPERYVAMIDADGNRLAAIWTTVIAVAKDGCCWPVPSMRMQFRHAIDDPGANSGRLPEVSLGAVREFVTTCVKADTKSDGITYTLAITGSRARAAIFAELFGENARPRSLTELARLSGVQHSAIRREVLRLIDERIVRRWSHSDDPRPKYEADPNFPGHLQLRRLMCLIGGLGARIREASMAVDPAALVWLHGPYAEAPSISAAIRIAAISREPRALRDRLREFSAAPGMERRRFILDVMSIAEWVTRLQKREMRLLAIRRAQRLWLMGDSEALRRSERGEVTSRETLQHAIKNWREELSDEWDENWDPFEPTPGW